MVNCFLLYCILEIDSYIEVVNVYCLGKVVGLFVIVIFLDIYRFLFY